MKPVLQQNLPDPNMYLWT